MGTTTDTGASDKNATDSGSGSRNGSNKSKTKNNKNNNGSKKNSNASIKAKFKGKCDGLEGFVFDAVRYNQADEYKKVKNEIAEYVCCNISTNNDDLLT